MIKGFRLANMFEMSSLDGSWVVQIPNPDKDSAKGIIATMVNAGRSSANVVTAQKLGRDNDKTEMSWNFLEKDEWESMARFWNTHFFFLFTYYSDVAGSKITRKFYVGDRERLPYDIDGSGNPTAYVECKANVIDTGEGD